MIVAFSFLPFISIFTMSNGLMFTTKYILFVLYMSIHHSENLLHDVWKFSSFELCVL